MTSLFLWTALLYWYLIPGVIAGILGKDSAITHLYFHNPNTTESTWLSDFTFAYSLESLAVCLALFAAIFIFKSNSSKIDIGKHIKVENIEKLYHLSLIHKQLIFVVFACLLVYDAVSSSRSYAIANMASLYGSEDLLDKVLIGVIKPIIFSMLLLIAFFEKTKILVAISFCLIFADAVLAVTEGSRIFLLTPVIMYIYRKVLLTGTSSSVTNSGSSYDMIYKNKMAIVLAKHRWNRQRNFLISFIILFLIVYFGLMPIVKSVQKLRGYKEISFEEVLTEAFFNYQESSRPDKQLDLNKQADLMFTKFDSFTSGLILTRESKYGTGYGKAGLNPYIGSLLVLFPRQLFPKKPAAGTSDGTIYTSPNYLVPRSVGIKSDTYNVGVSPLHVTFWHFGYYGLPIFIAALIINLKFINWLISAKSFSYNALGVYAISIPTFTTVIASPDVILKNIILLYFYFLILKMLKWVFELFSKK